MKKRQIKVVKIINKLLNIIINRFYIYQFTLMLFFNLNVI